MAEKSLRRLVLEGVFWLSVVKIFSQLFSWAITIYVIRILSPSDYGLVAMAGVYIGFIALFSELGLNAAVIQKKEVSQEDLSSIAWAVLSISVALCSISFFLAPLVAAFYNEPRVTDVVRVASLIYIFRSLGFGPSNMLVRELMWNRTSVAELMGSAGGAVTTLVLAMEGLGVWSLVWGTLTMELIRTLFCFVFYPWRPTFSFSADRVKGMMYFGSKVAVSRLISFFSSSMDVVIAAKILGKTQLGYYSVAMRFALLPLDKVVSMMSRVSFPAFSKAQSDLALLRRYYLKFVLVAAFVSFPACVGIFLVAESAVPLFLTEKWLPVVLPLKILSMVTAFRAIHAMNTPLQLAIGRPDITIRTSLINLVVMALCFYVGSSYGLIGLAYSWTVFPVVFLVTTSMTLKLIGLSLMGYLKELRHPFMGSIFMVAVVLVGQKLVFEGQGLVHQLTSSIVLGVASYILYYALFNREMFSEARNLLRR